MNNLRVVEIFFAEDDFAVGTEFVLSHFLLGSGFGGSFVTFICGFRITLALMKFGEGRVADSTQCFLVFAQLKLLGRTIHNGLDNLLRLDFHLNDLVAVEEMLDVYPSLLVRLDRLVEEFVSLQVGIGHVVLDLLSDLPVVVLGLDHFYSV